MLKLHIQLSSILITCAYSSTAKIYGKFIGCLQFGLEEFEEEIFILKQLAYPCIINHSSLNSMNLVVATIKKFLWNAAEPDLTIPLCGIEDNKPDEITAVEKRNTLKVKITTFAAKEVSLFGLLLSSSEIKPQKCKIEAIKECPRLKNMKCIQRFQGFILWNSSLILNYVNKVITMYTLVKKQIRLFHRTDQEEAIILLKENLYNIVMSFGINNNFPSIIKCDASERPALVQEIDVKRRPIRIIQLNGHMYGEELYAVIWTVRMLSQYIEDYDFIIHKSNAEVRYLEKMKHSKSKSMRWIMSCNVNIVHNIGKDNVEAKVLS